MFVVEHSGDVRERGGGPGTLNSALRAGCRLLQGRGEQQLSQQVYAEGGPVRRTVGGL